MSDETPPTLQLNDIQVLLHVASRAIVNLTEEEMDTVVATIKRIRRTIAAQSAPAPAPATPAEKQF
jgi:hypothetical protein